MDISKVKKDDNKIKNKQTKRTERNWRYSHLEKNIKFNAMVKLKRTKDICYEGEIPYIEEKEFVLFL